MSARNDWAPHFRRARELSSAEAERANDREVVIATLLSAAALVGAIACTYLTIMGWLG
jgi:hypothetical protein